MTISIVVDCKFKLADGISVGEYAWLHNEVGSEYNLANAIMQGYKFDFNQDLCPQDRIFLYDSVEDTEPS